MLEIVLKSFTVNCNFDGYVCAVLLWEVSKRRQKNWHWQNGNIFYVDKFSEII